VPLGFLKVRGRKSWLRLTNGAHLGPIAVHKHAAQYLNVSVVSFISQRNYEVPVCHRRVRKWIVYSLSLRHNSSDRSAWIHHF
jgi:hypothetical protein